MDNTSMLLRELLKNRGYSLTSPRMVVFKALVGQEPMTMKEFVNRLRSKIDRATIYRTIALFEALGIAHRLQSGWKYKIELTDKFSEHHHHLTCAHCKKIIPINEQSLEGFIHQLAEQYGYSITDHQIEIQGICRECQQ